MKEGINGVYRLISTSGRQQDHALFTLCGFAGLRVNEAVNTRTTDVDLAEGTIKIWGKGSKERVVPISNQANPYLMLAWFNTKPGEMLVPMSVDGARALIRNHGRMAGLSGTFSSHDLRATFATDVYNRTKDIAVVQQLLGHANVDTTRVYVEVTEDRMRAAVNCPC